MKYTKPKRMRKTVSLSIVPADWEIVSQYADANHLRRGAFFADAIVESVVSRIRREEEEAE